MQIRSAQKRTVRSFVRRTGRLTLSQQKALTELWPKFGIEYSNLALNLSEVFGRDAPVILEIGFGNGESLVQQATESPESNFLGVEVHEPGVGHCLLRIRDEQISNVRLVMHDAIEVLTHQLQQAALARINLYFPDPWPKKRHHKRRILQPSFLGLVEARLQANGTLNIATDWADYADHIDETITESTFFNVDLRREHGGDQPLDRPQTKFERRGLRKGHRIVDWRIKGAEPS